MAEYLPFLADVHWNVPKTGLLALCLSAFVWIVVSTKAVKTLQRLQDYLDAASEVRHRRWAWVSGLILFSILSYLKVRQYLELQTMWDMAVESNVAWHMVHGPWFFNGLDNRSHLGQHFAPVFVLLGIAYRMNESPVTLMLLQSMGLGLAVVGVYCLSLRKVSRRSWAPFLSLLFAMNWYVHLVHAHDFHRVVLGIPLLLWLLYFVECSRQWPAAGLTVLILSLEEGMGPVMVGVGLYLLAFQPAWRVWGAGLALVSGVYFLAVTQVLMPMFSPDAGLFFWSRYAHLGGNLREAMQNLLSSPWWALQQALLAHNQIIRVIYLLASSAFLPLVAWKEALLMVIPLGINLLSGSSGQYTLGHHYTAPALPFLFYAAACATPRVDAWLVKLRGGSLPWEKLLAGLFLLVLGWNVYRLPNYDLGKTNPEFARAVYKVAAQVPANASVAAEVRLIPLLVNRHKICRAEFQAGVICDWTPIGAGLKGSQLGQPEGSQPPEWMAEYFMAGADPSGATEEELNIRERFVQSMLTSGAYRLVERNSTVYLLRRANDRP